ncbi:MAG: PAS domain-containing sensor histidine kinase [Pedobacter sp.]|nr:MAG: PAS domain-containing sensor histidine kinase [Pedobacter sp.]
MENSELYTKLTSELAELKAQLEEANDTIEAIRYGQVDALVVKNEDGHQLYTLKSTDQTYRLFIEQMTESAITLNWENNVLYSNSQFALMLQLPLEKVIGKPFTSFIRKEDVDYAERLIEQARTESIRGEFQLLKDDGGVVPVLVSLTTLDLDEGPSLSIILSDLTALKDAQRILELKNKQLSDSKLAVQFLNDNLEKTVELRTRELEFNIGERIKVEEDLRQNEARLTSILQTMGEGLIILDEKGNIVFANKMAQTLFALSEAEILQRDFFNVQKECFSMIGKSLKKNQHPITLLMASASSLYDHELLVINAKDAALYLSINASTLVDDEGRLTGVVATYIDVTNRRKIALQKDEFISIASHELKTPLTSLKASMQLLSKVMILDRTSEKVPTLLEMANVNLSKVVRLTEDLMNVSKLQHGPLPLDREWLKLADLTRECGNQIIDGMPIELQILGELDTEVYADKQRIEQVLVNLLNNALKYAPESKTINVLIEHIDGFEKVSVQDFGKGIPKEKLMNLFDRYYQVDPEGKQMSGLGLGLYISSEIIQRHGGVMNVESQVGQGSTFSFTLPIVAK